MQKSFASHPGSARPGHRASQPGQVRRPRHVVTVRVCRSTTPVITAAGRLGPQVNPGQVIQPAGGRGSQARGSARQSPRNTSAHPAQSSRRPHSLTLSDPGSGLARDGCTWEGQPEAMSLRPAAPSAAHHRSEDGGGCCLASRASHLKVQVINGRAPQQQAEQLVSGSLEDANPPPLRRAEAGDVRVRQQAQSTWLLNIPASPTVTASRRPSLRYSAPHEDHRLRQPVISVVDEHPCW